jgi:hypothetical protein
MLLQMEGGQQLNHLFNSNVNSDVLIRIDSGGDPTPGVNAGTITYNKYGSDKHIMNGSSFGINTITPGSYALNVNGTTLLNNNTTISGSAIISGSIQCNGILQTGNTIAIKGTSGADIATLYLATPFTSSSAYKCALIAQGLSSWSRSKLLFCVNNAGDNTYPTQNAS